MWFKTWMIWLWLNSKYFVKVMVIYARIMQLFSRKIFDNSVAANLGRNEIASLNHRGRQSLCQWKNLVGNVKRCKTVMINDKANVSILWSMIWFGRLHEFRLIISSIIMDTWSSMVAWNQKNIKTYGINLEAIDSNIQ